MLRNLITALDVGTSTVQTVVAELKRGEENPRILGIGVAPSYGLRKGAVVDIAETTTSIKKSVDEASHSSGVSIKSVWVAIGGTQISTASSKGVVAVSRADGEISAGDAKRAVLAAETFLFKTPNREIIHLIPRDFKVDNEAGIKDPVGMHGIRLETDALIIESQTPPLKNLMKAIEGARLRVENYVFGPLAAAEAVLTKRQKELGVMLLDLGGGTASFIVFEEGVPIHAGVVPIGGNHITNDVAVGFQVHVDVAEKIKTVYGSCLPDLSFKKDTIKLAEFIEGEDREYTRKELSEIITARLKDIFEMIQKELKKIDRVQLLPAGVVVTGGSSLIPGVLELTKREIKLPVEVGLPHRFLSSIDEKSAPAFATALGVIQWAEERLKEKGSIWNAKGIWDTGQPLWLKWIRSLIP